MSLRISLDIPLPDDAVTQTLVVYGGKGMGKTNLGSVLAEELARTRKRFCVLDPIGVWWGLRHSKDGKGPGLPVLLLGGRRGDIPIEPTAGAVVADLVADEDVDVLIDISRRPDGKMWSIRERIRFATDFFKRLYERQGERRRPLMLIVDEAARFAPQTIPRGAEHVAECQGALEVIVEEGRNVGMGVTLITQRSARLAKSVAELAECMIAFRTMGPNSVTAILDWFGEHVVKDRWNALVEQLRKLPRGEALVVSPGWLEYEGTARIRMRETFDSSATPTGGERRATGKASQPDLSKYRERMAATIEKVKAEDPKALRARISQLEADNRKLATVKPAAAPADKVKTVEIEVVKPATVKAVERAADRCDAAVARANGFLPRLHEWEEAVKARGAELQGVAAALVAELRALRVGKGAAAAAPPSPRVELVRQQQRGTSPAKILAHPTAIMVSRGPGVEKLPGPQARCLTAIAQHGDRGVTREQLSLMTGYARSTRDRNVQYLAQKGLVATLASGTLVATPEGFVEAGDFEPLPTGDALRAYWMQRLPGSQRAILQVVVDAHPNAVDRDYVSTATGYARSTRDRNIQYLQARKLLVAEGRGQVRASEELFG